MDLISFLVGSVCDTLVPVMTMVGIVIFVIKIGVPLVLIVIGMITLVQALMSGDDKKTKDATSKLIKKVALGLGVYLVVTIVGLLMNLIGANADWESCSRCAFNPWGNVSSEKGARKCYIIDDQMNQGTNADQGK